MSAKCKMCSRLLKLYEEANARVTALEMELRRMRASKRAAGRLLDGREWSEMPAEKLTGTEVKR